MQRMGQPEVAGEAAMRRVVAKLLHSNLRRGWQAWVWVVHLRRIEEAERQDRAIAEAAVTETAGA